VVTAVCSQSTDGLEALFASAWSIYQELAASEAPEAARPVSLRWRFDSSLRTLEAALAADGRVGVSTVRPECFWLPVERETEIRLAQWALRHGKIAQAGFADTVNRSHRLRRSAS
jgi:hypothetical protein